jgi:alkaline phosphatase
MALLRWAQTSQHQKLFRIPAYHAQGASHPSLGTNSFIEHFHLNSNMIRLLLIAVGLLFIVEAKCQVYNASAVFAHNDYARAVPFHTAYDLKVGFIEADVFLIDSEILVAHHKHEIKPDKTLETLYLQPLQEKIHKNKGYVYNDPRRTLTLMIDLKTEGVSTLDAVVNELENYPDVIACPTLFIMISGSVPDPEKWRNYPSYITFDGRPGIPYTRSQLKRIRMISTSFNKHVTWDGTGGIPLDALTAMKVLMADAHAKKKLFRFWGTPDFENAWKELMRANIDVIVTDDVTSLLEYLHK